VDGDAIGVGAAADDAHDLVANLPGRRPLAQAHDGAGQLHARHLVGAGRSRLGVEAAALEEVGPVEGGGPHRHQDLLGAGDRLGDVLDDEDVDVPRLGDHDGAHPRRVGPDRTPNGLGRSVGGPLT